MFLDRKAKLSFSIAILVAKVQPYEFTWFELVDDLPVHVQEFPTKWDVMKNVERGTLKLRVFASPQSLFSAIGPIASGVHGFQINWLLEIDQPDTSNTFAYIGTLTQTNADYLVFEVTEFYGDTTKV